MMIKGIDCAAKLTAQTATAIKAAGYSFAGRYLVPNSGSLAWKALTPAEAKIITSAGLRILTVWETTANRANAGERAGAEDGMRAAELARAMDMPAHGIIYFAVDYDARATDYEAIAAYLRAARAQTGLYDVGVYGSYSVIEAMHAAGVCKGYWQCLAWSQGQKSAYLTVYQGDYGKTVGGIAVDINDCPDMDAAGIWDYSAGKVEEPTVKDISLLSDEECYEILVKAQRHAAKLPVPSWAREKFESSRQHGITDGTRPAALVTRCEAAIMADRAKVIK